MGWEMASEKQQVPAPEPQREQKEKKSKKKHGLFFKLFILIVALLVIATAGMGIEKYQKDNATYTWPSSGLATLLPQPASNKGSIDANTTERFDASINKTSQADYSDYIESCKAKGFIVDPDTSNGYTAFNDDGYKLSLSYYSSREQLAIELEAPMKMSPLAWPTMGAATLLPPAAATMGKIEADSASNFTAHLADMDKTAFNAYIDTCINAGYNVDYSRSDSTYTAKNADGASVSISYEGANIVRVCVNAPKTNTQTTQKSAPKDDTQGKADADSDNSASENASNLSDKAQEAVEAASDVISDVVTPEFKEMMDSYEAFMNQYCDFMVKYADATSSGDSATLLSMTADYASLVQQELDWASKIDGVDESTLSPADDAYYLEVQGRVLKKLGETGVSLS